MTQGPPEPGQRPPPGSAGDGPRQARTLSAWKLVEYGGLGLFLLTVPRAMGPELFGAFAAFLALLHILLMASGLGALMTFGRFIPEYAARGETGRVQQLFLQVLAARGLLALGLSGAFAFALPRILPGASPATAAAGAAALLASAVAATCYQLFYGLDRLGRWFANTSLNRLVLVGALAILGAWSDLERAAFAVLATELAFLALGLYWSRGFLRGAPGLLDRRSLTRHLGFGLSFFAVNLATIAVWRGGDVLILLFGGAREEVAYFSIAAAVVGTMAGLVAQMAAVLIPSMSAFEVSGEAWRSDVLMGYTLKYLTVAAFVLFLSIHAAGEAAVRLLVGAEYLPVLASLRVLLFALLPVALVRTSVSLAALRTRPARAVPMMLLALAVFVASAGALVPGQGARGAALGVTLGMLAAGLLAYFQFSSPRILAIARFGRLLALGGAAAGMAISPWGSHPAAAWGLLTAFLLSLGVLGVTGRDEIARLARSLLSPGSGG